MGFWEQLNTHLAQNAGQYLLLALALALLATLFAGFLWLRLRKATRPFAKVQDGDAPELLQAVLHTAQQTEAGIAELDARVRAHIEDSRSFVQHVGLVRYDAFEDVAGQQSFSLCLLNKDRDGVLITYLASKGATRSYAVTVARGKASRELSDEEKRAIDGALSGEPLVPA